MITIDQLLESVDLDFEPRWVTKDFDGEVNIWEVKPVYHDDYYVLDDDNYGEMDSFGKIKLSEFANKHWTECIYEVPQKEERTKWIGKLCRFWDGDKNCFDYGILKKIDEGTYITNDNAWYYHCEPVRPDDDVIYKDAVNELKGAKNE